MACDPLAPSDPLRKKPQGRRPRCVRHNGAASAESKHVRRPKVNAYVSLKDRVAREEIREHRQRLRRDLQERAGGWVDVS